MRTKNQTDLVVNGENPFNSRKKGLGGRTGVFEKPGNVTQGLIGTSPTMGAENVHRGREKEVIKKGTLRRGGTSPSASRKERGGQKKTKTESQKVPARRKKEWPSQGRPLIPLPKRRKNLLRKEKERIGKHPKSGKTNTATGEKKSSEGGGEKKFRGAIRQPPVLINCLGEEKAHALRKKKGRGGERKKLPQKGRRPVIRELGGEKGKTWVSPISQGRRKDLLEGE